MGPGEEREAAIRDPANGPRWQPGRPDYSGGVILAVDTSLGTAVAVIDADGRTVAEVGTPAIRTTAQAASGIVAVSGEGAQVHIASGHFVGEAKLAAIGVPNRRWATSATMALRCNCVPSDAMVAEVPMQMSWSDKASRTRRTSKATSAP